MNEWTVTYFTIVYSLPAIIGMCYVSSSLNFFKDCLGIILEKLHELLNYLSDCEKRAKIRASLSTDSELPKHITVYLDNSLTDEKYQLHLLHLPSHQK